MDLVSVITIASTAVAIGGGLIGLFKGIDEYKKSQEVRKDELKQQKRNLTLKRQEILFPLIKEFEDESQEHSKKMIYAKLILDDFAIKPNQNWKYPSEYYHKSNLKAILRDHRQENGMITDPGEIAIRASFDTLLHFYEQLGYLLHINLIEEKEILFFRYYLDKIMESDSVIGYIKNYEFNLVALLLNDLNCLPDSLEGILPNIKTDNEVKD